MYAVWGRTLRYYNINFRLGNQDGGGTLLSLSLPYGEMPVYTGETPTSSIEDFVFSAWDPPLAPVT